MPHIDPERLALLALGEPDSAPAESEHLADCAACIDELTALRHAAVAGRASMDIGELESPPAAVWDRIAEELSLGGAPTPPDAAPERPRRAWRIWALAASLVLVAGVGLGVWAVSQRVAPTEIAEAELQPFPDHPNAEGTAIVEEQPDGTLAVHVALSADAAPDTFREVWLITADASALVSLGVLDGKEQTFAVPAGVDLRDYVLVDVSQEPDDGDPDHSGDSIVRGELTFL
ncbi:Anti-sigma-K factor rskA [Microbacterium sp. cf046]|uniref:anti-sigma factor n=1 Tax=Microbacterium sp. cf046 TaxID=1761803 RepID=UPI0008E7D252|nr:anti-sigma factor [Microbacterium sp. cf046]SFS07317.1 Anti-sigma-K factor rskA [Microbacterium sp. cf046]